MEKAKALGLQVVGTMGFPTMARAPDAQGGGAKLVALKVVEPGYPLRGTLRITTAPGTPDVATRDIPPPGQAWVDVSLLDAIGLKVGETVLLGDAALKVSAIIVVETDRGGGFINFAPRVMINTADVAATKLIQPASRLNYRMAVAGDDKTVGQFVAFADGLVKPPSAGGTSTLRGARVESLQAGRPEMSQTLDRAEKFLSLVALIGGAAQCGGSGIGRARLCGQPPG